MVTDDRPTDQPPDSNENIDDDTEKEKTLQKKTTTFDIPNNTPTSTENVTTFEGTKRKKKFQKWTDLH